MSMTSELTSFNWSDSLGLAMTQVCQGSLAENAIKGLRRTLWNSILGSFQRRTEMPRQNQNAKTGRINFDAIQSFTDSAGDEWKIGVELKTIKGRLNICGFSIWSDEMDMPLSRRVLSEISLETMFREVIATEMKQLKRLKQKNEGKTAHQGRSHSDEELQVVADIYISAYRSRLAVQVAVATTLGISKSTAAKRIMAARSHGLIPSDMNSKDK
jgi:hypothetical protein